MKTFKEWLYLEAPFFRGYMQPQERTPPPKITTPANISDNGSIAFIYCPQSDSGEFIDYGSGTHIQILNTKRDFYANLLKNSDPNLKLGSSDKNSPCLFGRIGVDTRDTNKQNIVTFWENNNIQSMLKPCISKLLTDGKIDQNTVVYTPTHQPIPAGNLLSGGKTQKSASKQIAIGNKTYKISDIMSMLHVLPKMNPERQAIEAYLKTTNDPDLADAKSRVTQQTVIQNPWQKGMQQAGMINPGQKWWAPTSEAKLF